MLGRMTPANTEILARLPLFSCLDPEEREAIGAQMQKRSFRKGEIVYHIEDVPGSLFIVLEGQIRHQLVSQGGRHVTLSFSFPGACFGMLSLIDEKRRQLETVAVRPTELLVLNKEPFQDYLHSHPEAAMALLDIYVRRTRNALQKLHDHIFLDGRGRLAKVLLDYDMRPQSNGHSLRLSQTELASLTAATPESVNRWVKHFVREGCIEQDGEGIRIISDEKLRQYIY